MFEDYLKMFFGALGVGMLLLTLAIAAPGIAKSATSDYESDWSGATPDIPCEYEPLNTLPPTYDNE